MKLLFKKVLKFFFPRYLLVLFKQAYIYGKYFGQYNSVKNNMCLDSKNKPIPWFTYPAIEFIDNHILEGLSIFEYGSGNSSNYFLRKNCNVKSIEHNEIWFKKISRNNKNINILLIEDKHSYIKAISNVQIVDIIVIDGEFRPECASEVVKKYIKFQFRSIHDHF